MHANEVPNQGVIPVDAEGTVWMPCGGADDKQRVWRYIVDSFGTLSYDVFESLPTAYEPYTALDAAASSLIYRHLQGPSEHQPFATQKR